MKLRNLALTAGLLGTFFTSSVFALGLGEVKLNSSLNEPLDLEVELLNIGDMTELEMLVGLGSRKDFEQAGVERLYLLTDLRFDVDLSTPGKPVIRVSSRKPIREPYLDFLVEVQWPAGRLLREYTLLLDMPLYATESPSAKKIEAASQSSQPKVAPSKRVNTPGKTRTTPPGISSLGAGDGEYRVNSGDTVWGIAQKIKPNDASMQQTMAAIKQFNGHAFINDNINLLKKGAIIRLPEGSDIANLSDSVVDASIDSMLAEDQASAPLLDTSVADDQAPAMEQASGGGQLKLAALDQSEALTVSGTNSATSAGEDAVSDGSQNNISVVQEELDKTQRENTELQARIANLEEQVATMSRLVEIKDDSLRAAQVGMPPEAEPKAATPEASVIPASDTALNSESPEGEINDSGFDLSAWMDLLLYPLIALLAFLLAIVLFFKNRKQDDEEVDELSLQSLVNVQEPEKVESVSDDDTFTEKEIEALAEESVPEFNEQELKEFEGLELTEGEDVDPEGEADIYISLGNYKQAEGVLLSAIEEDSSNTALRLKLLEVYVNANELEKFDAQRTELAELNDPGADAKALDLRSELTPEQSVDETEAETEVAEAEAEVAEVSEDFSSEEEVAIELEPNPVESEEPETSVVESQDDFDLDLDLDALDMDSLSSDIDAEMDDLEIDEDELKAQIEENDQLEEPVGVTEEADDSSESALEAVLEDDSIDSLDSDLDSDLNFLEGADECSTKLDLAEAYLAMGDIDGARDILDEVIADGDDSQKDKARQLLEGVA